MDFNFYNSFSLDKWIPYLQDDFTDIYQEKYKAIQDYTLLELDKSDINYFLDNKTFDKNLKLKIINTILNLQEKYKEKYLYHKKDFFSF